MGTPKFAEAYKKLKEAGKKFEVIFASSDKDEAAFKSYWDEMPWLALKYELREEKEGLADKFKCQGIPHLVILDARTMEVVTYNGRGGVSAPTFIEDYPFSPKPMYDIGESLDGIMDGISLMVIQDYSDEAVQKQNSAALLEIAKDFKDRKDDSVKTFFTANGTGGPCGFIRSEARLLKPVAKPKFELTQLPMEKPEDRFWGCDGCEKGGEQATERYRNADNDFDFCEICIKECEKPLPEEAKVPKMILFNIKASKYYNPAEGKADVTKENMLAMIQDHREGKLTENTLASRA